MNVQIFVSFFITTLVYFFHESQAGMCPDGSWVKYLEKKCYKLITEAQTWKEGERACKMESPKAIVGTITSLEEQSFLEENIFKLSENIYNVWIGASKKDNKFVWPGEEAITYGKWAEGSPSDRQRYDCVEISTNTSILPGHWSDVLCINENYVLCELPQSSDIPANTLSPETPANTPAPETPANIPEETLSETRGPEIPANTTPAPAQIPPTQDSTELRQIILDMKKDLDSTRHNLTVLLQELKHAKNDINSAHSDIFNVIQATGGGRCLDNTWVKYSTTKCYKLIKEMMTWLGGVTKCKAQSSDAILGTIKSSDEQAFLLKYLFLSSPNLNNVWLGATRQGNQFIWPGGETLIYTNWTNGSPSNTEGQNCVEIDSLVSKAGGRWKDVRCTNANHVLCELPQFEQTPANTSTPNAPPTQDVTELQQMFSNIKNDLDITRYNLTVVLQELIQTKKEVNAAQAEISNMKQTSGGGIGARGTGGGGSGARRTGGGTGGGETGSQTGGRGGTGDVAGGVKVIGAAGSITPIVFGMVSGGIIPLWELSQFPWWDN